MFGRLFLDHPRSVDESYFEHLRFVGGFALRLLGAGVAALVHALVPNLFEKTVSQMITQMHDKIHNR
jgi:hypothetical protein